MTTPDLQTVAWLYHDAAEGTIPEPGYELVGSTLLSLSRHPSYRNETPLVLRSDALARIEALERERDAAVADARRYRWLKKSWWYIGPPPEGDLIGVSWEDANDEGLDGRIDAAIAQEKQP